jgi:quercetin dioxygenase-like cupin family protein
MYQTARNNPLGSCSLGNRDREIDLRTFDNTTAESYLVADIEVVRWEQYGLGDAMPFNAMWYTVPPGSTSPADCHPELELSVVLSGSATVSVGDGSAVVVERGGAFLIDSDETHTLHNGTDAPVLVFSAYWMPTKQGTPTEPAHAAEANEATANV